MVVGRSDSLCNLAHNPPWHLKAFQITNSVWCPLMSPQISTQDVSPFYRTDQAEGAFVSTLPSFSSTVTSAE